MGVEMRTKFTKKSCISGGIKPNLQEVCRCNVGIGNKFTNRLYRWRNRNQMYKKFA